MFRKYNIIEYKNPADALNIDVVWKCIGYAGIYKGHGKTVNEIPDMELTVSIFRNTKPIKLLDDLEKEGHAVDNPSPGIYRISGLSMLPLQIVISSELEEEDFKTLRLMMPNADETAFHRFMEEAHGYTEKADRQDASAVLHVISASNRDLFRKIWEEQIMQDYLTELMSEKFEEAENRGREGERSSIIERMLRNGKTPEEISSFTGLALDVVKKVQGAMLQPA